MERSRAAIITGASRGIGEATSLRLARDGFDVVVHYHHARDRADATAEAVRKLGREAIVVPADIADASEADHLVREGLRAFPHLDTLVNNAGMYPRKIIEDVSPDEWMRVLAVNAQGAFNVTRPLVPHLKRLHRGRIVNLSSVLGAMGSKHGVHYSASKAAVLGFTKSLARELAPHGILVNAVCPGAIETDMIAADTPDERARREKGIPVGRVGTPDEIAGVIAFLVGPDASYVTGQTMHVNGGLYIS